MPIDRNSGFTILCAVTDTVPLRAGSVAHVTELSGLPDLTSAGRGDLVGQAVLDGVKIDGADLSGVSAAQVRLLECALVDCHADAVDLPGITAVDTYVGGLASPALTCRDSDWRDATWAHLRVGALLADGSDLTDVTIRSSRIDLLSLRGGHIRRLTVRNCRIDTLDLSMSTVDAVAFHGGTVGELLTDEARMTHVDVSHTELGSVGHPGSLRGLVLSAEQVSDIAPALAVHLGIHIAAASPDSE
jgi:hypothetical protein